MTKPVQKLGDVLSVSVCCAWVWVITVFCHISQPRLVRCLSTAVILGRAVHSWWRGLARDVAAVLVVAIVILVEISPHRIFSGVWMAARPRR